MPSPGSIIVNAVVTITALKALLHRLSCPGGLRSGSESLALPIPVSAPVPIPKKPVHSQNVAPTSTLTLLQQSHRERAKIVRARGPGALPSGHHSPVVHRPRGTEEGQGLPKERWL